ncbi:uncharacterized protein E5676_scaffold237G001390 [Cucumis melo var. makuwa]|uniref:Uncharacterized protein n=1 Tax=Cucumis melo var. makuwa TaxID=1194695 RepID=A0A5A7T4Y2_CUCMM|nr:uncharacterized protein E6C27_scaffold36G002560 [Cucumis melo var. makuwa]TYK20551.1 uncharacterized protein E5676_scaffold237G001390 [Cucumis melo var. makuwa]
MRRIVYLGNKLKPLTTSSISWSSKEEEQMSSYVKFLTDILAKKIRINDRETMALTQATRDIFKNGVLEKMIDPNSFLIPYSIGGMDLGRALCDLKASINFMSLSIFMKLEIREFPTDDETYSAIESLRWDYCEEEVYHELFNTEEFFEEEDLSYILKEVNIVSGERNFESLDLQTKGKKKTKPSIEEPPKLELKHLPNHLKLEEGQEDTIQFQRWLNPAMKEVVKKEIIKWLDAGVIYPITNSEWVSPVQCVPKKGRMIVVKNEKND